MVRMGSSSNMIFEGGKKTQSGFRGSLTSLWGHSSVIFPDLKSSSFFNKGVIIYDSTPIFSVLTKLCTLHILVKKFTKK